MKHLSILFFALIASTTLWAKGTKINGIHYILDGASASVTYTGDNYDNENTYSGAITIPSTVTFKNTTYQVTSIGDYAFIDCNELTSVTVPKSVTHIGDFAFVGCTSLTITIPNSVISIGRAAFSGCTYLTSVTIPKSVSNIGDYAFYTCTFLRSICVDAVNTHFASSNGVLFNYTKDVLIQYPVGNPRTQYSIPNGVTHIGGGAFNWCSSLTSIIIPKSVTSMGEDAFRYCTSLTSLTCYATTPPACEVNCFEGIDSTIPIYVPNGSITAYQTADGWKDFSNIRPMVYYVSAFVK